MTGHRQLAALLATVTDDEVAAHLDYFGNLGSHYEENLVEIGSPDR